MAIVRMPKPHTVTQEQELQHGERVFKNLAEAPTQEMLSKLGGYLFTLLERTGNRDTGDSARVTRVQIELIREIKATIADYNDAAGVEHSEIRARMRDIEEKINTI